MNYLGCDLKEILKNSSLNKINSNLETSNFDL